MKHLQLLYPFTDRVSFWDAKVRNWVGDSATKGVLQALHVQV